MIITILGFVALFLALQRVDAFLRIKAVDECAKNSRYEETRDGVKVWYPVPEVYKNCLKDKGY